MSSGFSQQIFQHDIVEHRIRQEPLELGIFVLELLQPLGIGQLHPAILGLQLVERRRAEAVSPAYFRRCHSCFLFLDHPDDLRLGEAAFPHVVCSFAVGQTLRYGEGTSGGQVTLFVFDDISDSFDYKNKFAIIDFLEDVTKTEDTNFLAIVLTHNFDFLRTVSSRDICPAHQCRLAFRSDDGIKLEPFERADIQSPFRKWQGRLAEPSVLIAYIPFLRNLIEYTLGPKDADGNPNADYLQLTRMLHFKDETEALTIEDYKDVFERHLAGCTFPDVDLTQPVIEHLFATADECEKVADGINLEHKIALSIAIRMRAERYMVAKIRSAEAEYDVSNKQTGKIFQKFKDLFNNEAEKIGLLRRVNLITPANIHLNSFMYEPILDMGMAELVTLYQNVKSDLN